MSAAQSLPIVRLSYELAYLGARERSGMCLSSKERSRLVRLRRMFAFDVSRKRRVHRRFELEAVAVARFDGLSTAVKVIDLSAGGCCLVAPVVLRVGQRLKLSFEFQRATFVFFAEVKRLKVEKGSAQLGVAFDGIPLEVRRFRPRAPSLVDQPLSKAS